MTVFMYFIMYVLYDDRKRMLLKLIIDRTSILIVSELNTTYYVNANLVWIYFFFMLKVADVLTPPHSIM